VQLLTFAQGPIVPRWSFRELVYDVCGVVIVELAPRGALATHR